MCKVILLSLNLTSCVIILILRLLVQIHDELLLEVADEDLKQVTGNKSPTTYMNQCPAKGTSWHVPLSKTQLALPHSLNSLGYTMGNQGSNISSGRKLSL